MDIQRELISRIIQKQDLKDVVDRRVKSSMFSDSEAKKVFQWVLDFYRDYSSVPTIELVESEHPEYQLCYAKQPIPFYIDKLSELHAKNKVQEIILSEAPKLFKNPMETVGRLQTELTKVLLEGIPTQDVDITQNATEQIKAFDKRKKQEAIDGLSMPWKTLTDVTRGKHGGQFFLTVARPKIGKTWQMVLNANHDFAVNNQDVLFISNEMSPEALRYRWYAIHFGINYTQLKEGLLTDVDEKRFKSGLKELEKCGKHFNIVSGAGLGVSAIAQKIQQYNPGMIYIDGIYLTSDDMRGKDIWARTTNVSRSIKQLCLRINKPIWASTQFSRSVNSKTVEADLGDIGFADAYGQDPDLVLGMLQTKDMKVNKEMMEQVIAARDCDIVSFKHMFDLSAMNFRDINEIAKEKYESEEDEKLEF